MRESSKTPEVAVPPRKSPTGSVTIGYGHLLEPVIVTVPTAKDVELRSRSIQSKAVERERPRSVSSQTTFDPINTRLSKSNENLSQGSSQRTPTFVDEQRAQRITRSEDRQSTTSITAPLNDLQIQRFNLLQEKFERQQPIDTVFGMSPSSRFTFASVRAESSVCAVSRSGGRRLLATDSQ